MNEPLETTIIQEELSEWQCELFGTGMAILLRPTKSNTPNWFWRWMQYLIFGNRWSKK